MEYISEDLYSVAAEIDGLAAILSIIAQGYLENDGLPADRIAGEALFGVHSYAKHIAREVEATAAEIYKKALKK